MCIIKMSLDRLFFDRKLTLKSFKENLLMNRPHTIVLLFLLLITVAIPLDINSQVNFTSSNMPIIVIDTYGQTIVDDPRIRAHMGIIFNDDQSRNYVTNPFNNYDGWISIEIRGSSSQYFYPKKQYAVETIDSVRNNLNVSLLGLPEENDWILHAPYSDKTLVRNALIYQLSNDIGRYASRCRFCELILNGDYQGVYVLMEKIKRDKNRVDIAKLNPEEISGDDLTGGYIIKIDKFAGEEIDGWVSPYPPYENARQTIFYQYHYPKPDDIATEQKQYIQDFIAVYEDLMNSSQFNDRITGYHTILDVESFVDYFLLNEIGKNVDGYRLSAFMYKDKDSKNGKLFMGPIWDFNLAFGNADYYDGWKSDGWEISYFKKSPDFRQDGFQVPFWWCKLYNDPYFQRQLQKRWRTLRENHFSQDYIFGIIDSLTTYTAEAVERNFQKWNNVIGQWIWPNYYVGQSYQEEVNWMKQWIYYRINWIDQELEKGIISEIQTESVPVISDFMLMPNYPNPFNKVTIIQYRVSKAVYLKLEIIDLKGNRIAILSNRFHEPGSYQIYWDGIAENGSNVGNSIYLVSLSSGRHSQIRKVLYLK